MNTIYFMFIMNKATTTPRERRQLVNRKRILDGAMAQVVSGGLGALSINRLAREVDYTPGALYRYFPSKEALIVALTAQVATAFGAILQRTLTLVPADAPLQRVVVSALTYRDMAAAEPNRFALISLFMAEPKLMVSEPEQVAPGQQAVIGALSPLAAAFHQASAVGALADGDAIERTICWACALHGVLLLRKQAPRAPEHLDVDRLYLTTLRALLVGWGAHSSAVDDAFEAVAALGDLVKAAGDNS